MRRPFSLPPNHPASRHANLRGREQESNDGCASTAREHAHPHRHERAHVEVAPTKGGPGTKGNDYAFTLGGKRFDLVQQEPAARVRPGSAAIGILANGHEGEKELDFCLVQLKGVTTRAALDELEVQGYTATQYIAPYGYVMWGPAIDSAKKIASLEALPGVRAASHFKDSFKGMLLGTRGVTPGSGEKRDYQLLVYRGADFDAEQVAAALVGAEEAVLEPYPIDRRWAVAHAELTDAQARAMTGVQGVLSVQPVPRRIDGGLRAEKAATVMLGRHEQGLPAAGAYAEFLEEAGVTGRGVSVAVMDGKVDEEHPALEGKVDPCEGDLCHPSSRYPNDHGTHVAGTIAARATDEAGREGYDKAQGIAPGARIVSMDYDEAYNSQVGLSRLLRGAAEQADISQNSWGPDGSPKGYEIYAKTLDAGVIDANPEKAGQQRLIYVLSIMNGSGGTSSQGTPDEAKNALTVGSTSLGQGRTGAPPYNSVSSNSAHGPALDGRTQLPKLVAPGCGLMAPVPGGGYVEMCGTSMASPTVSASAALFLEKFRRATDGDTPSPAMVTGAAVAACMDLAGGNDADGRALGHRPDDRQGFGRLNLRELVLPSVETTYIDEGPATVFTESGQKRSFSLEVVDPGKPAGVVLSFSDAPGHGLGGATPAWNNNLTLEVSAGDKSFVGNNFDGEGYSAVGGEDDPRHNLEAVYLRPSATGGRVSVNVHATNINSDAVPDPRDITDQPFTLTMRNLRLVDSESAAATFPGRQ